MLNILVPTDFSPLSKVAVLYAIKIAEELKSNITLLHVINITRPTRVSMHEKIKSLEDEMLRLADHDLFKLVKEVSKKTGTNLVINRLVVQNASFKDAVRKEAKRLKTGLIVMGTKGATGLKKKVIGSNTFSVIESMDIPVLVVPDKAKFKGFRDIVYASDLKNLEKELKSLKLYANRFGSTIHILHVTNKGDQVDVLEEKMERAVRKLRYKNSVTLVLVDSSIEGAIDQYVGVCKADCLTMFTHKLNFFEKLFDKSFTRNMAFQSKVPVLAFKKGF